MFTSSKSKLKKNQYKSLIYLFICLSTLQFTISPKEYFFQDIPVDYSGITFKNMVKVNVNYMVGEENQSESRYLYENNSSGVGVGDFNNDGLIDIFFSGNLVANKMYLNKGEFKFEDISTKAGIEGNGTWGVGVSVVDINGDGQLDIYVSHSGDFKNKTSLSNELFINQGIIEGIPRFKESAREYGLDLPGTQTTQSVFFDYDKDGDLDVFILNHSRQPFLPFQTAEFYQKNTSPDNSNRLLKNELGHFIDVTSNSGIIGSKLNFGLGVVVSDIDNDGWPDIYCTSDFTERDFCYLNRHDGSFEEIAGQAFTHLAGASMGVDAADFNNDGRIDIINTEMKAKTNYRQKITNSSDNEDDLYKSINAGYHVQLTRNVLQVNLGNDKMGIPHFSDFAQMSGIYATEWSWAPLFADFDNDGWKDLFISAGFPDDNSHDKRNNFIKKLKEGKKINPTDKPDYLGYLATNSFFFKNNLKEGFSDVTNLWKAQNLKMSYASAYADFDNDGSLDMIISNLNDYPTLLRNLQANKQGNYLSIFLKQKGMNQFAIGAKVIVQNEKLQQTQEMEPVRGYASSQDYSLHFGLGKDTVADIKIIWPDGTFTVRKNVKANNHLVIENPGNREKEAESISKAFNYTELNISDKDSFISKQYVHPDFKYQFSLPYKVSDFGQVVSAGDIDGDGLTDYYIGGEAGIEKFFMMGKPNGQFRKYKPDCFELADENSAAILFDMDKDGDLDLMIESRKGRIRQPQSYYSDTSFVCRAYQNNGKGLFHELTSFTMTTQPSKVMSIADIDNDGDLDVFIGGYSSPLNFGKKTKSYLLRNESKYGNIHFTDITKELFQNDFLGMVTSAVLKDINNDLFPDLLLATEWGPCKILYNIKGKLFEESKNTGLQNYTGLWSMIHAADINGDGFTDLIVGNVGINNQFRADIKHPMKLSMIDFENNGNHTTDAIPIMSIYEDENEFPIYYRDEILSAVQKLRPIFFNFETYATCTIQEMINKSKAFVDTVLTCNTLQSGVFQNDGKGHFIFSAFPAFAQISRINAVVESKSSNYKLNDLLIGGNFFGYKIQFGREDALPIVLLKNKGNSIFEAKRPFETGLFSTGQVSNLYITSYNKKKRILIFRKNEAPQLFEYNNQ